MIIIGRIRLTVISYSDCHCNQFYLITKPRNGGTTFIRKRFTYLLSCIVCSADSVNDGVVNTTISGLPCADRYEGASTVGTCRNPNHETQTWCYTADNKQPREYCLVPSLSLGITLALILDVVVKNQ